MKTAIGTYGKRMVSACETMLGYSLNREGIAEDANLLELQGLFTLITITKQDSLEESCALAVTVPYESSKTTRLLQTHWLHTYGNPLLDLLWVGTSK